MDSSTLAQVASIIAAFGVAMLFFRIERELQMAKEGEQVWIPAADWLLILATLITLLLVVLPLVLFTVTTVFVANLARAGCVASTIMLAGYCLSILAHYRLIFGTKRRGPRDNPEPAEKSFIVVTAICAVFSFLAVSLGIV